VYEIPANVHWRREHGFRVSNADQGVIILYTFLPFVNLSMALGTSLQWQLAPVFNGTWHQSSMALGTSLQWHLTPVFNGIWHQSSVALGTSLQRHLAPVFNGIWHQSSKTETLSGLILECRALFITS
jgi:hypothetical protein